MPVAYLAGGRLPLPRFGLVLAIEEGGARAPQPRVYAAGSARRWPSSAAPPIEAGSQRLDCSSVSVTWTLE